MSRCRKRDTDLNLKSTSAVRLREETATNDVVAFGGEPRELSPSEPGVGLSAGQLVWCAQGSQFPAQKRREGRERDKEEGGRGEGERLAQFSLLYCQDHLPRHVRVHRVLPHQPIIKKMPYRLVYRPI